MRRRKSKLIERIVAGFLTVVLIIGMAVTPQMKVSYATEDSSPEVENEFEADDPENIEGSDAAEELNDIEKLNDALEEIIEDVEEDVIRIWVDYAASGKQDFKPSHNIDYEERSEESFVNSDVVANIYVRDTDFEEDNLILKINGIEVKSDYSQTGINIGSWEEVEDGSDIFCRSISFQTEGEFQIDLDYINDLGKEVYYDKNGNNTIFDKNIFIIDYDDPEVEIKFYDQKDVEITDIGLIEDNRKYLLEEIKAVITVRDAHFNIDNCTNIIINELDNEGKEITDDSFFELGWTEEAGSWKNEIEFNGDANYTFEFRCKDYAGNENNLDYFFTIDTTAPECEIVVDDGTKQSSWKQFFTNITWGLFSSKEDIHVSVSVKDSISGIAEGKTKYYLSDEPCNWTALESLDASDWQEYEENGIILDSEQEILVYVSAENGAGIVGYYNSDGLIIDRLKPQIFTEIKDDKSLNVNGIYNDTVFISVDVEDPENEASGDGSTYSGIKEVSYKLYKVDSDSNELIEEDYLFNNGENTDKDYIVNDEATIENIRKNPSDLEVEFKKEGISGEFVLFVYAEDNAGNKVSNRRSPLTFTFDTSGPDSELKFYDENGEEIEVSDDEDIDLRTYVDQKVSTVLTVQDENIDPSSLGVLSVKQTTLDGDIITGTLWEETDWSIDEDGVWKKELVFNGDANYEINFSTSDVLGNSTVLATRYLTVDTSAPTGNIMLMSQYQWNEFFTNLTLGLHNYNEPIRIHISAHDDISGVRDEDIKYIKVQEPYTRKDLEELSEDEWSVREQGLDGSYEDLEFTDDEEFIIYVKLTNRAGIDDYYNTDGIVLDTIPPIISELEIRTEDPSGGYDIYNTDVEIYVELDDSPEGVEAYSGIKEAYYKLYRIEGDIRTEIECKPIKKDEIPNEKSYVEEDVVSIEDIREQTIETTIQYECKEDSFYNVELYIYVEDNAGETYNNEGTPLEFSIDTKAPTVKIVYYDLEGNIIDVSTNEDIDKRTYKNQPVKAEITVVDNSFKPSDADDVDGLIIKQKTFAGAEIEGQLWTEGEWKQNNPGEWTKEITFTCDANYIIDFVYKDMPGNPLKEPFDTNYLTIDKTAPVGSIKIESSDKIDKAWSVFFTNITWGLFSSNAKAEIIIHAEDDISGVSAEEIKYYKSSTVCTRKELEEIEEQKWIAITGSDDFVDPKDKFIVYAKITNRAGLTSYYNTDGIVLDETPSIISELEIITDDPSNGYDIYNTDVEIYIEIEEPSNDSDIYSGIKEAYYELYRVENNSRKQIASAYIKETEALADKEYIEESSASIEDIRLRSEDHTVLHEIEEDSYYHLELYVYVENNAGETYDNEDEPLTLTIDTKAPEVDIVYYDSEGKVINVGTDADIEEKIYENQPVKAEITVIEDSFKPSDAEDVEGLIIEQKTSAGAKIEEQLWEEGNWILDGSNKWTKEITFVGDANYTVDFVYQDMPGNSLKDQYGFHYLTVDKTAPVGNVTIKSANKINETWSMFFTNITWGLFSSNSKAEILVDAEDDISGVNAKDIKYLKSATALTRQDLEEYGEDKWTTITGNNDFINPEDKFIVYAKITNRAGLHSYYNTDGVVLDITPSIISKLEVITDDPSEGYDIYNTDVEMYIEIEEPIIEKDIYSGIKEAYYELYKVENDDKKLIDKYYFRENEPSLGKEYIEENDASIEDIRLSTDNHTVLHKKTDDSYYHLELYVYIEDNAGVTYNNIDEPLTLTIDTKAPEVDIVYYDSEGKVINVGTNADVEERTYTNKPVKAEITVIEDSFKPSDADDVEGLKIERKTFAGKDIEEQLWEDGQWALEGTNKWTKEITFVGDANYIVDFVYEDMPGNSLKEPYGLHYLTVDKSSPTGSIEIQSTNKIQEIWDAFFTNITWGLLSSNTQTTVIIEVDDDISGVRRDKIKYYKSDIAYTKKQLEEIVEEEWLLADDLPNSFEPEDKFIIYAKITNRADLTTYYNSDGILLDDTAAIIIDPIVKTDDPSEGLDIYNTDVTMYVSVKEPSQDDIYSGLKTVRYELHKIYHNGSREIVDEDYIKTDDEVFEKELVDDENSADEEDIRVDFVDRDIVHKVNPGDYYHLELIVYAVDNAGNESDNSDSPLRFTVDKKRPEISVKYFYDDGTEDFYPDITKASSERSIDSYTNRVVRTEILIDEHSFIRPDAEVLEAVIIDAVDVHGNKIKSLDTINSFVQDPSNWISDDTKHRLTIKFDADAHLYSLDIAYKDLPGNDAKFLDNSADDTKYPTRYFTIDKVEPVITVKYSSDASGFAPTKGSRGSSSYANKPIKLEITIDEDNFILDAGNRSSGNPVDLLTIKSYDLNNNAMAAANKYQQSANNYNSSEWKVSSDTTVHTFTTTFNDESNYTLDMKFTDLAGNEAVFANGQSKKQYGMDYFTYDATPPEGNITVGSLGTWEIIASAFSNITFGASFTNTSQRTTLQASDNMAGLKAVEYYVSANSLSADAVRAIPDSQWSASANQGTFDMGPNQSAVVYEKITDRANNITYLGTDGIVLDNVDPAPQIEIITAQPAKDVYNGNVQVQFNVTDPVTNNSYAGINNVYYEIRNGSQVTQSHTYQYAQSGMYQSVSETMTVDASLNNSNDVTIYVRAEDNAGNYSETQESIKIDITKPTISVTFDNNNALNGDYYKDVRTATVVITERNFDESAVNFTITNTDGTMPAISGWSHSADSGVSDSATHTATVVFSADGDYTMTLSAADLAGNTADYSQVDTFTMDFTLPTIQVAFDNESSKNEYYYKDERTATITINEHNFNSADVKITMTAKDNGKDIAVPAVSGWSGGGDIHTATIHFADDADYTLDIEYADLAGNQAAKFEQERFVVDKTVPELEILGVEDKSANKGTVAPIIEYSDTNYDESKVTIKITGHITDQGKLQDVERPVITTAIENGERVQVQDFPHTENMDNIYTLTATIEDKAGNISEDSILFSVNRFGSNYTFDQATQELLENFYTNQEIPIVVTETNVDTLEFQSITYSKDGQIVTLEEGLDYTVDESGTEVSWKQYTYTIFKQNFVEEGAYTVTIYSEDRAENATENKILDKDIEFIIDKTPPSVVIAGVEENRQYNTDTREVTVEVKDNTALEQVQIVVNGDTAEAQVYGAEEVQEMGGSINTVIGSHNRRQKITVNTTDKAGNLAEDEVSNFLITTNLFVQFYQNKPIFYTTVAATGLLAVAVVIVILMKRKKEQEEKAADSVK